MLSLQTIVLARLSIRKTETLKVIRPKKVISKLTNAKFTDQHLEVVDVMRKAGKDYVSLKGAQHRHIRAGSVIDIYRYVAGNSIRTATVKKVTSIHDDNAFAHVIAGPSQALELLEPDYAVVMVGDRGAAKQTRISKVIQVTPSRTIFLLRHF